MKIILAVGVRDTLAPNFSLEVDTRTYMAWVELNSEKTP